MDCAAGYAVKAAFCRRDKGKLQADFPFREGWPGDEPK